MKVLFRVFVFNAVAFAAVSSHAPLAQVSIRGGFILKAQGAYDAETRYPVEMAASFDCDDTQSSLP